MCFTTFLSFKSLLEAKSYWNTTNAKSLQPPDCIAIIQSLYVDLLSELIFFYSYFFN